MSILDSPTLGDVDAVVAAGATFIVTPGVSESVAYASGRGVPVLIPGRTSRIRRRTRCRPSPRGALAGE
jgi:2-keto-3-deoxy-6-phosphogluconate aldolase